jgi:hypothetical protein
MLCSFTLVTPPAWNDDDRTFRVTNHVFGYAPNHSVLQSGASMSRSHHQINSRPAAFFADFVDHRTGLDFRLAGNAPQETHFQKLAHFLPGSGLCGFDQGRKARPNPVNCKELGIGKNDMKETESCPSAFRQTRRILYSGEGAFGKIHRDKNFAQLETDRGDRAIPGD